MTLMSMWLMLVLFLSAGSQDTRIPTNFSHIEGTPANGSSATGHCLHFFDMTCTDPVSSVLFDDPGGIPILNGLDGYMWAGQLLTIQPATAITIEINFEFHDAPNFSRVEVMMFNCPEWEIGVERITIFDAKAMNQSIIAEAKPTVVSCDSLVRICLLPTTPRNDINTQVFTLQFNLSRHFDWVFLAEVTFFGNSPTCPKDMIATEPPLLPTTLPITDSALTSTSVIVPTQGRDATIIAISVLLLLLLVLVVVVVLVLWRCRHQRIAKEEASHTSSQTHTHVVSLCEETGQVQYEQDTDQDSLYSSIPPQFGQGRKEANKDDILHTEKDEMGGYDVIPLMPKPLEGETKLMVNLDNNSLLKDVSTASLEMETQFDYTYATVDKKMGGTESDTCASLSANEDHLPQLLGKESPEDQLYANTKRVKEEEVSSSLQKPVHHLYAQVDKKKKAKEPTSSPQTPDAQVDEAKEPTSSLKTAVDQLCAQVDKKKQKSKEKKEVYPEESGAVYSVVNKPSPPKLPTKSQELLEELATSQC